jgi:hypothetical protein
VYAFSVTYRGDEAARAERAFRLRSARELRTFYYLSELAVLIAFATSLFLGAPSWVKYTLGVLILVSIVGETFFYFACPAEARRLARRYPNRHITIEDDSLCVAAGGGTARVPWAHIRHVWTNDESVMLVLSPFQMVSIPRTQFPTEAYERMLALISSPPNNSLERTREG